MVRLEWLFRCFDCLLVLTTDYFLQIGDITIVGEEFEDLASYTDSIYAFHKGLCIAATSFVKPKG